MSQNDKVAKADNTIDRPSLSILPPAEVIEIQPEDPLDQETKTQKKRVFVQVTHTVTEILDDSDSVEEDEVPTMKLIGRILYLSIPLGVAAVAQNSIGSVMVAMVGRKVGVEQLGATSLAFGLLFCTAFSLSAGCSGALETMLSYTYGKNPHSKLYGVYCQRVALLTLLIALLIVPILTFSDSILIAIGQNPVVAGYTGQFCRIALIGVVPSMLLEVVRRYFACQQLNNPLSVSLFTAAVIFPFLLYALITLFGYSGAPLSWALLQIGMPASLIAYLYYTKKYKKTWGGWSPAALRNWKPMLKLALPSIAIMMSEWGALEVNCLSAGFATPPQLAAYTIFYLLCSLLWSWSSGVYITVAVLVGNSIGEGRNMFAKRCAILCLILTAAFGLCDALVLTILGSYTPTFFSDNEETIATYPKLLPIFCVYHFFDLIQSCMMGILRGCGMQNIGAIAITVVYSIVGVPLGMIIFFTTNVGVKALWIGPMIGVTFIGAPLYAYLFFFYIPWTTLSLDDDNSDVSGEEEEWEVEHPSDVDGSDNSSTDVPTPVTPAMSPLNFVAPQRNILASNPNTPRHKPSFSHPNTPRAKSSMRATPKTPFPRQASLSL